MIISTGSAGRTIFDQDKEYLFFSGTSYLGINTNAAFRKLLNASMDRYGSNYSTSRKSNFQLKVYQEAEEKFAHSIGTEAAITVSSGFMAGQLVVRAMQGVARFHYAPDCHPAIWLEPQNFFPADFFEWVEKTKAGIRQSTDQTHIVVTNSIDSLTLFNYSFDWLAELAETKDIILIIDDSHGMGVLNKGRGIFPGLPKAPGLEIIVVASIGKAMGLPGGIILGTERRLAAFRKSPWFGTSSPASPAYLDAYLHADDIYHQALQSLQANILRLEQLVQPLGKFRYQKNYPVFYTPENALYAFLLERKILVSSFSYPSPDSTPLTRIVVNSHHSAADIDQLAGTVQEFFD